MTRIVVTRDANGTWSYRFDDPSGDLSSGAVGLPSVYAAISEACEIAYTAGDIRWIVEIS
jgi:hypothetical protein